MKENKENHRKINRICMLNPQGYFDDPPPLGKTDTGGQIVYVLELAKALAKKNIKVDIITRAFSDYPEEEKYIAKNLKIVRIPTSSNKFIPKERLYEVMPEFVENFIFYVNKKRKSYNLIHSHYWDGGYAGILIKKILDIPHVHTPHTLGKAKKLEMDIEEAPIEKLKPYYRYHVRIAIEQKIYRDADLIIILCEMSRIQLLHYYIVDFDKIKVIFPGVNTEIFNLKPTSVDKTIKLKPNAILSVSRIVPAKGIDRVIDALNFIKNKAHFHYYICGDFQTKEPSEEEKEARKIIQKKIKDYKLQKRVTFVGYLHQNETAAYYRKSNIFILPSRYEPFGLTTLEAMACGKAPIVSHIAGSREVIIDGLNGFIVNSHDRKKLSDLILRLLKDTRLFKKISRNAFLTIKDHYSWDKISEKIINVYKTVINQ